MRLLFRQRLFSWFDSYDIYDEAGNTVYTVEGKAGLGTLPPHFECGGRPHRHCAGAGADLSAQI